MRLNLARVLGGLVLALAMPGCPLYRSPCDFVARCTAPGQYERCYDESDEKARVDTLTCPAANSACLALSADEVACVHAPATPCDASFVERCEGAQRVYCDERFGWAQAVDCTTLASTGCHIDPPSGKSVCD